MGQPAHDILLAVGILRGYTSPMWIMELQLKYLNAELRRGAEKLAVAAPDMSGLIVSLSALPTPCIKELLSELKNTRRGGLGQDVYYLYSVNGWEVMRSRVLVKNMMALEDQKYPFHFVNANDLQLQKPRYAAYVRKYILRNHKPIGENLLKQESDAEEDGRKSSKTVVQRARRKDGVTFNFFFANDATLRRYYNAACTKQPHLLMPSVRSVAIVNGNLVGRRDEAVLRAFALKNKLSSPIWLTENLAKRLGVHILPKYRNKYVRIGSGAAEANEEDSKADSFYNIDDFAKPSEILSLFPKSSKHAHFMLDAKWRPVVGKQRQEFLKSLGRKTPLWVSVNECLMSGFEVKPNVPSIRFPSAHSSRGEGKGRARGGQGGSRLYNSQYTSDPVRVIGLSTDYVRPQGLHL
ncbi:hypothetical protein AGDE_06840 [Angomonas deanei]|uniref:Trypanosoma Tc-38 (p38) protein domain-containing protein n=1 Tax=Angomonas deanei TaxID=59799 RepID=A0A7G2CAY2_9TRYP|nr:hypothetical protein AGDE_06840 [Angomonas deanei]CAD2216077.1 hypothetical protein, conserved [Angomonas deanei]|eukprot:EPY36593.1 hypothetical protein AGDE_06840 [Angomonas deanei]